MNNVMRVEMTTSHTRLSCRAGTVLIAFGDSAVDLGLIEQFDFLSNKWD